jgi:HEAT repeat protein
MLLEPADVRPFLTDPSVDVRVAAVKALTAAPDPRAVDPDLITALDDEAAAVRSAAITVLADRDVTPAGLVDLLTTGSTRSQAAALVALRGHGPDVRPQVIAWTEDRLGQAAALRSARQAIASPVADGDERGPVLAFLTSVLAGRERVAIDDVLAALVVLGNPEAGGVIRRSLSSSDPETRAQAIEALDTIGDRALSGTLVGLLDDGGAAPADRMTTLAHLADDDDPWIARLARLLMSPGTTMPDTSNTIADIDTMLFLRRVPLFEGLGPEDLQRVAAVAVEHVYPAGEALVREGEFGDDLVIIVEGSVRVVRAEPDGSERLIRRYAPGDHIGELAVLRDAPRAATVIAEGGPVRGLVIGGEGLRAILRERPEAAMALLATLAERISRQ